MFNIPKQYPNTQDGAIQALLDLSFYKQSQVLGVPKPDPVVEGVWIISIIYNAVIYDLVIYMAGYKEATGKFRLVNSLEKLDFCNKQKALA